MKEKIKKILPIVKQVIFIAVLLAGVVWLSILAYKKYTYYRPMKVMKKFMEASINNDVEGIEACCHPYFYDRIKPVALSDAARFEEYRKNGAKISYKITSLNIDTDSDDKWEKYTKEKIVYKWEHKTNHIADANLDDINFDINKWTNRATIDIEVTIEVPKHKELNTKYYCAYRLVEIDNKWYVFNTYRNEDDNYDECYW